MSEETLSGVIERITFHNLDNGYAVLKVKAQGKRDLVTVVGHTTAVVVGEYFEAVGTWITDRDHGVQFKAAQLKTTPPHTAQGIARYLGSGLVPGIGPQFAKRIVAVFGERTLDVIDQSPTFLSEVKGLGPRRIERIRTSWQEQKNVRRIMVFLQSYGIGTQRAVRIYKTYGEQAVEMVRSNPYRLSTDIWGVGFKTADELAQQLGVPRESPLRARAAVRYVLQQFSEEGHAGYPLSGVIARTAELTGIPTSIIESAIEEGRTEAEFVREVPTDPSVTTGAEPWLFLKPIFLAELGVARSLLSLQRGGHPLGNSDCSQAVTAVEAKMGIAPAESQRRAIQAALREKVLVITGGPGVGKTTIVRGIIDIFTACGMRVALCAPTGRAAKRLTESTGREARTIHRLLEFDPIQGGFRKNREQPLEFELIVVDEASMIDLVLMNQFLRAVAPWSCLILVGDVDQLPSVGPGSVLADLIESKVIPVVRLTEIFRQAGTSWIVRAAHAVNRGEEPPSAPAGKGDFYFLEVEQPEQIIEKIITMARERIPAKFGLDPIRDVQVLAPMNRTELGVRNLNQRLQAALNPPNDSLKEVQRFGTTFRVGDKVMQIRNNYSKEAFNGDIGRIFEIDLLEQQIVVDFEGKLIPYEFGELDELQLAFAGSIHKSQGSEFAAVLIPLHTQHFKMLQRNLLYTGITRGKKLVVVVGSRKALRLAVRNADTTNRFSLLRYRLRDLRQAAPSDDGDAVNP